MKTRTHYRFKNHIVDETRDTPTNTSHKSINQAKKESFKIQMWQDGALGRGSVSVS